MPQNNDMGAYQIPRDFSGKSAPKTVTKLEVGQNIPVEENNPIYETGGISWGALSLITLIVIILGIIMVRYMNTQSWREFYLRPNARKREKIENDIKALNLINDICALNRKAQAAQKA